MGLADGNREAVAVDSAPRCLTAAHVAECRRPAVRWGKTSTLPRLLDGGTQRAARLRRGACQAVVLDAQW